MKFLPYCQSRFLPALLSCALLVLAGCGAADIEEDTNDVIQSPAPDSSNDTRSSANNAVASSSPNVPSVPVASSSSSVPSVPVATSSSSVPSAPIVNASSSVAAPPPVVSSSSSAPALDIEAPTVPRTLKQEYVSPTETQISWRNATDNVGVVAYRIYRNGKQVAQVGKDVRKYNDTSLNPDAEYAYTVRAGDAAGNWSISSPALSVKTLALPKSEEVVIEWYRPNQRENGDYLELDELGGYEIRYKLTTETDYKSALIPDGLTTSYNLGILSGSYQIEIAAFDSNGLYSQFVPVSPL